MRLLRKYYISNKKENPTMHKRRLEIWGNSNEKEKIGLKLQIPLVLSFLLPH
jgi:hypothetical protein